MRVVEPTYARTLRLTAPPHDIGAVHDLVDGLFSRGGTAAEEQRMRLETALVELVSSILNRVGSGDQVTCTLHLVHRADAIQVDVVDHLPGASALPDVDSATVAAGQPGILRGVGLVRALVGDLEVDRIGDFTRWRFEVPRVTDFERNPR